MILPKPKGNIRFVFERGIYAWSVCTENFRYISPYLSMRGGSVWEQQDGYRACWRWLGAI